MVVGPYRVTSLPQRRDCELTKKCYDPGRGVFDVRVQKTVYGTLESEKRGVAKDEEGY
jgi:hypothetical protein